MTRLRGISKRIAGPAQGAAPSGTLLVFAALSLSAATGVNHREFSQHLAPLSPVAAHEGPDIGADATTDARTEAGTDAAAIVGQIGGSAYAVAVEGETVYAGIGPRVVILDASGDGDPVVIGQSPILPRVVSEVVVMDGIVYAASRAGLAVIDAREPDTAKTIAFLESRGSTVYEGWGWRDPLLAVGGGLVYFAPDDYAPVQVLDVSTPSRPTELATLHVAEPIRRLRSIAADGERAYLAYSADFSHSDTKGAVAVFDVQEGHAPLLLGVTSFDTLSVGGMTVAGQYVIVSRSDCAFEVLDASDPTHLKALGCEDPVGIRHSPWIVNHGFTALVRDESYDNVWIVDWSDPHAPELIGSVQVAAVDVAISESGDRWFVARGEAGMLAYEATGLLDATQLSEVPVENIDTERRLPWANHVGLVDDAVLVGVAGGTRVYETSPSDELVHAADIPFEITCNPVVLEGDVVLLAGSGEVHAFDLSNPVAPRSLGVYAVPGTVRAMIASGSMVVVAGASESETGFIEIVDYSTPESPRRSDHRHALKGAVSAAAVEGDRLFVARGEWLDIWDIGRPDEMVDVRFDPLRVRFEHIVVRGGYVYGASGDRLTVLDVRAVDDIRQIFTTGDLAPGSFVTSTLAFLGDTLVVPSGNDALGAWLFDVSDPAQPRRAGILGAGGSIADLIVAGERVVYLFDEDRYSESDPLLLRTARVDAPMDVRIMGRHPSVGYAESVTVSGALAYVVGWPDGLHIVDIAEPGTPRLLSTVELPKGADRVAVEDGYAYVVSPWQRRQDEGRATVHVIDVSDPRRPVIASSLLREGRVRDLSVDNGRLYLAESSGLTILDVKSEPGRPREIGRLPSRASEQRRLGGISHVVVTGERAVIVDGIFRVIGDPDDDGEADELRTVDVSDPTLPQVIGAATLGIASSVSHVLGLDLLWPHAYALTPVGMEEPDDYVFVVDVARPDGPKIEAGWLAPRHIFGTSLSVADNLIYVGTRYGILVLDRTAAVDPQVVAEVVTPGLSSAAAQLDVDASGGVYFANGDAGLVVLQVDPDLLPEPTPGPSPTPRPIPTAQPTATASPVPTATTAPTPVTPVPIFTATPSPTPVPSSEPIYMPWGVGRGGG